MKIKPHCGPAFPFNYHNETPRYQESFTTDAMIAPDGGEQYMGLSMRDYLAAKAMQGILAGDWERRGDFKHVADMAYMHADEMLRAGGHLE